MDFNRDGEKNLCRFIDWMKFPAEDYLIPGFDRFNQEAIWKFDGILTQDGGDKIPGMITAMLVSLSLSLYLRDTVGFWAPSYKQLILMATLLAIDIDHNYVHKR